MVKKQLVCATVAAYAFVPALAQPYRCTVDGKTVYQQTPCSGGVAVNTMGAGQADLNSQAAQQARREAAAGDRALRVEVAVANRRVFVGMTADEVVRSWGHPSKINQTLTGRGSHEQWIYRRGNIGDDQYVYMDNGVVSSLQSPR